MTRYMAIFVGGWIVSIGLAGDPPDDRALIERAPGQRAAPVVAAQEAAPRPAAAQEMSPDERTARIEANTALAKLQLVLGRKALEAKDFKTAAVKAQRALVLIRQLPPEVDASEMELQAEGILARAVKAGVNVEALARDANGGAPLEEGDAQLDRRVDAAAQVGRQYSGSQRPEIDTSGDARALRERTLQRQKPEKYGYRPGREIIDVDSILARDEQRLYYEGALSEAYRSDEMRILTEAHEARIVPDGDISYPNDWPQRVERRKKWKDGVVARSPSWYDKDGREWYVAIYDIHDLIYVPPDFGAYSNFGDPKQYWENEQDRIALRNRSMIFGGNADDLAAGIPLLRYFGGVDPWVDRGPKYSAEKQAEVVEMIRAFTGARVEDGGAPVPQLGPPPQPAPPQQPMPRQ